MDLYIDCRAVLFDMDGVLMDSTVAVARVWRKWAEERGFDPEYVARIAQGRPSLATIRELLPDADHEAENRLVEQREMEDLEGVTACAGARELLAALSSDRWALVTSSTRPLARVRLAAGGLPWPRHVVTSNDTVQGKPHPEPFLRGASLLGIAPQDCLVVEDTPAGIRAGQAAGCRVLALRATMPEDALIAAHPDWITDECSNLQLAAITDSGWLRLHIRAARGRAVDPPLRGTMVQR